ncbi:hypothetical protein GX50_02781 [[Emmonsia] crescens]|uniref:Uncharacterized protein n=1 Tax=[Emmonsia] crescens TaxID=73230 RepID=A0A2B7ZMM2_9EURO|nr:hypothetical protein GX50_02781 [Emmonsia crescens]
MPSPCQDSCQYCTGGIELREGHAEKDEGLREGSRVRNLACQALVKKQHIPGNQPCSDFLAIAFSDGHANNTIADFELGSIRGSYYLDPAGNIPATICNLGRGWAFTDDSRDVDLVLQKGADGRYV